MGAKELWEFVTPDGKTFNLHDFKARVVMVDEGTGMPPIEYLTEVGPLQHGETVVDYRLRPRDILLAMRFNAINRDGYNAMRKTILNAFRPNRQTVGQMLPGWLRKRESSGDQYEIAVRLAEGLTFSSGSPDTWDGFGISDAIAFVAHDPVWRKPTREVVTFINTLGDFGDHLVFPTELPLEFGGAGDTINGTGTVVYPGTWLSYPEIQINGPLDDFLIQNVSTGEEIELDYAVVAGKTAIFDLRYGYKTCFLSDGTNLTPYITLASDLTEFHIAPDPEVPGGVNELLLFGTGAVTGQTAVTVRYYVNYIGI